MPDFTTIRQNALPLDFTDEQLDIGDKVEFVSKMNSLMTELSQFSSNVNDTVTDLNAFSAELSQDDVIQARRNGYLTFETKAAMDLSGAPPTASPQEELSLVWKDGNGTANNGVWGWDGTEWVKASVGLSGLENRGFELQDMAPNLLMDVDHREVDLNWTGDQDDRKLRQFNGINYLQFIGSEKSVYSRVIPVAEFNGSDFFSFSCNIPYKPVSTNYINSTNSVRVLVMQLTVDEPVVGHGGIEVPSTRQTGYLKGDEVYSTNNVGIINFNKINIDPACKGVVVMIDCHQPCWFTEIFLGAGFESKYRGLSHLNKRSLVYVDSANGFDNRLGTMFDPVNSIAKAIELIRGNGTVVLFEGEYLSQIDIRNYPDAHLSIVAKPDANPIINLGEKCGTSWADVSGQTDIWSIEITTVPTQYVIIEGLAEKPVDNNNRFPHHRSRSTRLIGHRLTKADSIGDIASNRSSGEYSFFHNGTTLYITTPTGQHPNNWSVYIPSDNDVVLTNNTWNSQVSIDLVGLDIRYAELDCRGYARCNLSGVSVFAAKNTGILTSYMHTTMNNVEVSACGIDGVDHRSLAGTALVDGIRVADTTLVANGLYSHDNYSYGLRGRYRAVATLIDGLFEGNGVHGCAAESGGNISAIGCTARLNGDRYLDSSTNGHGFGFLAKSTDANIPSTVNIVSSVSDSDLNGFGVIGPASKLRAKKSSMYNYRNAGVYGNDPGGVIEIWDCDQNSDKVTSEDIKMNNGSELVVKKLTTMLTTEVGAI